MEPLEILFTVGFSVCGACALAACIYKRRKTAAMKQSTSSENLAGMTEDPAV